MKRVYLVGLYLLFGGCAGSTTVLIDGKEVPRVTTEYVGQRYRLRHQRAHPRPGGPSSGVEADGGTILGNICGSESVVADVEHRGDHVAVGSLSPTGVGTIEVRDQEGLRVLSGQIYLGNMVASVDIRFDRNRFAGAIGPWQFSLNRQGSALVGIVSAPALNAETTAELRNFDALFDIPAAVQGRLLPGILLCSLRLRHSTGAEQQLPLLIRFGPPYDPSPLLK